MQGVNIGSEDLLNGTVNTFRVAISLRVVTGRHVELTAQSREEGTPEIRVDTGISVRNQYSGEAVGPENILQVQVGQRSWEEMVLLVRANTAFLEASDAQQGPWAHKRDPENATACHRERK